MEYAPDHEKEFHELKVKTQVTNAEWVQHDISKGAFDPQVDRLISFEVIEHLPSEEAVKNLQEVDIDVEIIDIQSLIPFDIKNDLSGLFYLINYLDWLSYWCGHLNDVDIAAVKSIDILKKELA